MEFFSFIGMPIGNIISSASEDVCYFNIQPIRLGQKNFYALMSLTDGALVYLSAP
jgi:hypothetical protein